MKKRFVAVMLAVAGLLATTVCAKADDWSYFVPVGNNVSVSFTRVDNTTYTWKFRNDGYNRITYMKFAYSYVDADTGQYKTDFDYLPGPLAPGEVIGGWAAFTATTRLQPTIAIAEINRE